MKKAYFFKAYVILFSFVGFAACSSRQGTIGVDGEKKPVQVAADSQQNISIVCNPDGTLSNIKSFPAAETQLTGIDKSVVCRGIAADTKPPSTSTGGKTPVETSTDKTVHPGNDTSDVIDTADHHPSHPVDDTVANNDHFDIHGHHDEDTTDSVDLHSHDDDNYNVHGDDTSHGSDHYF